LKRSAGCALEPSIAGCSGHGVEGADELAARIASKPEQASRQAFVVVDRRGVPSRWH